VAFTQLVDAIRARRIDRLGGIRRRLQKGVLDLAINPAPLFQALRLYARSGLRRLFSTSGLLKLTHLEQADRILPPELSATRPGGTYRPFGKEKGHVALFPGCVGRYLDTQVHQAAIDVLLYLGYRVTVPQQPSCCGALHRHNGFAAEADRQSARSARLFGQGGFDAVLSAASACTGELLESTRLGPQIHDITRFLADQGPPGPLNPRILPQRALIHVPCTQRNLLHDPQAAFDLLRNIPGLELSAFPDDTSCCGSAGTFMLREPQYAQALLLDKIAYLRAQDATLLITTNTGCALHLAAGIRAAGLAIEVRHPVEVLAQRLPAFK
jgi:glycolate oxidase iron-sulfur subunit